MIEPEWEGSDLRRERFSCARCSTARRDACCSSVRASCWCAWWQAALMNALPISSERLEHLRHLEAYLHEQIRGQDHVIPRVVSALHRGDLGLTSVGRPRSSFLLLGPTGVGKTELTIAFTRYLFGDDKLFRFDMSEYQTQESLGVLLGARIGEVGLLGMARAKSATGTLLFDEIEKAQQSLRPELYARITEKLVFNRLSYEVQMEIARLHVGRELSFLRDKGFHL